MMHSKKKWFVAGLIMLSLLTNLGWQAMAQTGSLSGRVGVSAHRGASGIAPENTLATFKMALTKAVDYIEIDVRTTKDGQLVILHDGNLDRTTTGTGPVKEKTLAELRELSAGKGGDPRFLNEKIPTLEEVCQVVADWNAHHAHKTNLYVDCKAVAPEPLIRLLSKYQLLPEAVFYGSDDFLMSLKAVSPIARLMPGLKSADELAGKIARLNPYAFDVRWQLLSEGLVRQIHEQRRKVFSDALDFFEDAAQYRTARQLGVDVIQTDYVDRVFQALAEGR